MQGSGEWEVREDARAETRFHFRTDITSVVPRLLVSGCSSGGRASRPEIVAASIGRWQRRRRPCFTRDMSCLVQPTARSSKSSLGEARRW